MTANRISGHILSRKSLINVLSRYPVELGFSYTIATTLNLVLHPRELSFGNGLVFVLANPHASHLKLTIYVDWTFMREFSKSCCSDSSSRFASWDGIQGRFICILICFPALGIQ